MPSSLLCTSTSTPVRSRSALANANPHGPLTRPPKQECTTMRGSPSASSNTSTITDRSDEIAPTESSWLATYDRTCQAEESSSA